MVFTSVCVSSLFLYDWKFLRFGRHLVSRLLPPPLSPFLRGVLRTHTNTRRKIAQKGSGHCRLPSLLLLCPPPLPALGAPARKEQGGLIEREEGSCLGAGSPSVCWLAGLLACCTQYSHTCCFSTDNRMIQNVGVDSLGCLVFLCLPASLYKWDRLGGRNAADYQLPDPFNFPLKLRTCALCLLSDSLCRSFTELRPFHCTMHPPVHPSIHSCTLRGICTPGRFTDILTG